ncbi:MAG: glycosyltransferase [Methanobacteriaceae archaeon]|jgi:glycosyltransferase involved in cell wall biosynthesis|nr:glycosyltransferase [Candidatus Methanorudis spinitermitis]
MSYKISIVVPVYNVEKYIETAFKSIKNQTIGFNNLELIMVNDCSKDNSGKIIDRYAKEYDNCIAIHLNENSGAAGRPRNVAIENASSDYIMFLDPDDYYEKNACQTLYHEIIKESKDIVFGNVIGKKGNNRFNMDLNWFEGKMNVEKIEDNINILFLPPSLSTKIIKREFLIKNDIKFLEGVPGQDSVFVVENLFNANGIKFLMDNPIYTYVFRDDSITNNLTLKYFKGAMFSLKERYYLYEKHGYEEYFRIHANSFLNFFLPKILATDLESEDEIKEILAYTRWFTNKCVEIGSKPSSNLLLLLFNLMVEGDIENILRYKKVFKQDIKGSIEDIAKLQSIKGWISYKKRNILERTKKRFFK